MRFLAAQAALSGARFAVADPHAEAGEESLAATLAPLLGKVGVCDVASSERDIIEACKLAGSIGAERIAGDTDRTPVILWLDELNSLLSVPEIAKTVLPLLEQIAREYRKVSVFASLSGQGWNADRIPSALKHSMSSVICHRLHRDIARILLPTGVAALCDKLTTGQVVL